ncbi:isopentenyl-diphosphate Delta-isomerase [Photobacterium nomapromontoriensis]|uniref:isopentenyl-diphosphate Delta-isomerase n=1 Tax=Photobacterium nomapromontoriensis TaxID=2910237 RepID=UPI003D0B4749
MIEELVILVDPQGRELGAQEKMQAHRDGALHLAFSVLLYRNRATGREYLLQQRAMDKYHSGGLWTNTCCSHPRLGETMEQAGIRRLAEEMGIVDVEQLDDIANFIYQAKLDNQLVEHELDHVLVAESDVIVEPNPAEVMAYRWWPQADLAQAVAKHPTQFTAWFNQVLDAVEAH